MLPSWRVQSEDPSCSIWSPSWRSRSNRRHHCPLKAAVWSPVHAFHHAWLGFCVQRRSCTRTSCNWRAQSFHYPPTPPQTPLTTGLFHFLGESEQPSLERQSAAGAEVGEDSELLKGPQFAAQQSAQTECLHTGCGALIQQPLYSVSLLQ